MKQIFMCYKDIQKYFNEYHSKTNKTASLYDAVFTLYKEKTFFYHSKNCNNIVTSVNSVDQLASIMEEASINVTSIISKPKQLYRDVSENYFMFLQRDARSMLQFQNEQTYLHKHNYFEINIVLQGKIKFTCLSQTQILGKGNLIIISPDTNHKIEVTANSTVICIAIKKSTFNDAFFSLLKGDNFLTNFFNQGLYSSNKNYLIFLTTINSEMLSTLQNIYIESYSTQAYANKICSNYVTIFFSYALRYLLQQTTNEKNSPNTIITILNEIKCNYKNITLTDLAQKFNYDKDYLGKLIKNNTGQSFNYLRNYYRINNSYRLLKYTNDSVKTISEKIGYNSPNHFERCFALFNHISPTAYRKKVLNTN